MATEMRYGKDTYDFFPRMRQSLVVSLYKYFADIYCVFI